VKYSLVGSGLCLALVMASIVYNEMLDFTFII
jgi:hypothetical protein